MLVVATVSLLCFCCFVVCFFFSWKFLNQIFSGSFIPLSLANGRLGKVNLLAYNSVVVLRGVFLLFFFLKIAMSSTLLFQDRNANWDLTHFAEIFCYLVIFAFIDIKQNSTLKDILKAAL